MTTESMDPDRPGPASSTPAVWTVLTRPPSLSERAAAATLRNRGRPGWLLAGGWVLFFLVSAVRHASAREFDVAVRDVGFLLVIWAVQWQRRGFIALLRRYHAELHAKHQQAAR